ncbi:hypothetical protein CGCF413_v013157 [Colletotrichum fructicola]|nr:hypothetical protein CGCF413_v013157 [Colletotrichum fructicola]
MINRGKAYVTLCGSGNSIWFSEGPAFMSGPAGSFLEGMNPDRTKKAPRWCRLNTIIHHRVVFDTRCKQDDFGQVRSKGKHIADSFSDKDHMICWGLVTVTALSNIQEFQVLVPERKSAQNAAWRTLEQGEASQPLMGIHDLVKSLWQPEAMTYATRRSRSMFILLRARSFSTAQKLVDQLAESARKPCFWVNYFDIVEEDNADEDSSPLPRVIEVLQLTARTGGIVCFENFAHLVAQRSVNEPKRSGQAKSMYPDHADKRTKDGFIDKQQEFIEILEVLPSTAFLWLTREDGLDSTAKRIVAQEFDLDADMIEQGGK